MFPSKMHYKCICNYNMYNWTTKHMSYIYYVIVKIRYKYTLKSKT